MYYDTLCKTLKKFIDTSDKLDVNTFNQVVDPNGREIDYNTLLDIYIEYEESLI